ncbi:ATP-citrate synthase alpha chain protein 1 [Orobanche gracilis]
MTVTIYRPFLKTFSSIPLASFKLSRRHKALSGAPSLRRELSPARISLCCQVTESTDFNQLAEKEECLSSTKLVVKPDMLFGKHGESGLVVLNLDLAGVAAFIKEQLGKEVENSKVNTTFVPTGVSFTPDLCAPLLTTLTLEGVIEEFIKEVHALFLEFIARCGKFLKGLQT